MTRRGATGYDCTYCGMNATDMDHVIPRSYAALEGEDTRSKEDCVPACMECNGLLSNNMVITIAGRAGYLVSRLADRHKKLLETPDWSNEDLEELEGRLRTHVKSLQLKKKLVKARISYAQSVSLMVDLTIEGVWDSQSSSLKKIADNHPASDSTPISYSGRGI